MSLLISGLVVVACGSDDDKKTENDGKDYSGGGDGGADAAGGDAPIVKAGSGGSLNEAGQASVQGGDAGTGSSEPLGGAPNPGEGGAGGEGNVTPFHGLYVGENGDDTAAGTSDAPFETLAHAASIAQAGDTIVFLDGSYDVGALTTIAAGVNLMAENAGAVTLVGNNQVLLNLEGDTRIAGLEFQGYSKVVQFADGAAAQGTLSIEDSTFTNCTQACLDLKGSVQAVVTSAADAVLGNGGLAFALLSETASLSITGGVLKNYGAAGIIRATADATVELSDLEVLDGTGKVLILAKQALGTVTGLTVSTLSAGLFDLADTSELTVTDSDIGIKPNAGGVTCFYMTGNNKLSVAGTKAHGCGTAVKGAVPVDLKLIDSEFYDLTFGGADLDKNGSGKVLVDNCQFHDIAYTAMRIGGSNTLLDLTMRDTHVDVTTLANWGAVILNGTNASTIDLGTLAEPGGNTFLQHTAAQNTALQLQVQGMTVQAVGNTWTPNQQGADAEGHYSVKAGKVLEDSTAVTSGINYLKPYATTTLRLAQIP